MKFFHKDISGKFTIPSGIITTNISIIKKVIEEIPQIGIITTKSIGPFKREGNREPIIAKFHKFSFINAVGLANPGAKEFAKQLSQVKIPKNRFLLASIFGANLKEFIFVAKVLCPFIDGFELNISCPHAKGYGQKIGEDFKLVYQIIKEVKKLGKPVLVKISPNVDVTKTVKVCLEAGVDGFCAINTLGPGILMKSMNYVLSNKIGGISGKAILPIGINVVSQIRKFTDKPIIACGGISNAEDIKNYKKAGANFFGIGSLLSGLDFNELKRYFFLLEKDLSNNTNEAEKILKDVDMEYKKYQVDDVIKKGNEYFILKLKGNFKCYPGQFVFIWHPKKGEKPFSVFDDNPLSFFIKKRGILTDFLSNLKKNDFLYIRGPYGKKLEFDKSSKILICGGGCGIAGLYLVAKNYENVVSVLGTKTIDEMPFIHKFKKLTKTYFVTENGSLGEKGLITKILEKVILKERPEIAINCGPRTMIQEVIKIELNYIKDENIYSAIEYITKCGIGICGSCATKNGFRNCVDGPFFNLK